MESPDQLSHRLACAADGIAALDTVSRYFAAHQLYYGHGTSNARDEAAWLVNAVLGWRDARLSGPPSSAALERIAWLAHRRVAERKPLAYLLQEAWFAGLKFYVDERVLVPRSPLAELIEHQLAPWVASAAVGRVLDLGTGSGCLAIALATYLPAALVDATDSDGAALIVARCNVSRHQLAHRVRVLRSDLFAALSGRRYDVIVSNPPYVPAASLRTLPTEYGHEPSAALAAGDDGLALVRRVFAGALAHLTDRGVLIVEVGEAAGALIAEYPQVPFTWLEFARGGEGVLVLTADQLWEYFAS